MKVLRDLEAVALRDAQAQTDAATGASVLRLQIATSVRLRAEDGLFPDTPEYDELKALQARVEELKGTVKSDPDAGMSLNNSELCPVGQAHVGKGNETTYVGLTDRSVHLGGRVGPTALKYMGGEFDDDGVEQGPYSEQNKARGAFTLAISAHKLLRDSGVARGTIEGFLGGGQVWEPGQDKLKWCAPAGDVKIDEDTSYPGEVCNEGTFNRPARSRFLSLGGYFATSGRSTGLAACGVSLSAVPSRGRP